MTCQIKKEIHEDEKLRKMLLEVGIPKGMTLDEAIELAKQASRETSNDAEFMVRLIGRILHDC